MFKEFDWEQLEKDMDKILEIVKKYPENLQEKCFEFIKEIVIKNLKEIPKIKNAKPDDTESANTSSAEVEKFSRIPKIHGNVLAMLRKNDLVENDLGKLFMLDHDPILPIYKLPKKSTAKAQTQRTYMILLENAITSGQFKASYAEVRNTLKDEGLFDGNFTLNLRKESDSLSGAVTKDKINEDTDIVLAPKGYQKLASIISELSK